MSKLILTIEVNDNKDFKPKDYITALLVAIDVLGCGIEDIVIGSKKDSGLLDYKIIKANK